jgi:hypothetical protein
MPRTPSPPLAPLAPKDAGAPPRSPRPRTALRSRHIEAHAVAWLRSLREREPLRSSGAEAEPTPDALRLERDAGRVASNRRPSGRWAYASDQPRTGLSACVQDSSWSNRITAESACWGPGANVEKFSKSVNIEKLSCWRTCAI